MRVLIVAKSFPPRNSAQALQMSKVVEAIDGCGGRTTVITATTCRDNTAHDGVLYLPCRHRPGDGSLLRQAFGRILGELSSCWPYSQWVQSAIAHAIAIIRGDRPDCLMTSSTPFESHLVGLELKRQTGIPWVASFSDPWPSAILPPPYKATIVPLLSRIQCHLLRQVLERCDLIHMPSRYGVELVQKACAMKITQKSRSIPHIGCSQFSIDGYEYCGWLGHVGHLPPERVSTPLLAAVQRVRQEMPQLFHGLLCVGTVCPEFRARGKSASLEDAVKIMGPVSQQEACRISLASGALLVIEADMEVSPFLPSKVADYAMTGRPILAITPAVSAIRDYFASFGGGIAVCHDIEQIAHALRQIFGQSPVDRRTKDDRISLAEVFSSSAVGSQYMEMFSTLV